MNYQDMAYNPGNPITQEELDAMSIMQDTFTNESVVMVHAAPKVGKTYWVTQLACSAATGTPFLGKDVKQLNKILYIAGEISERQMDRRMAGVCESTGMDYKEICNRIRIISTVTHPDFNFLDCIEAIGTNYDMIIVDPIYVLYPNEDFSENDNPDVIRMLKPIGQFCKANRIPVIIVHHNRKGSDYAKSADAACGAGALRRYPEANISLSKTTVHYELRDFDGREDKVVFSDQQWRLQKKEEKDAGGKILERIEKMPESFTKREYSKKFNCYGDSVVSELEKAILANVVSLLDDGKTYTKAS